MGKGRKSGHTAHANKQRALKEAEKVKKKLEEGIREAAQKIADDKKRIVMRQYATKIVSGFKTDNANLYPISIPSKGDWTKDDDNFHRFLTKRGKRYNCPWIGDIVVEGREPTREEKEEIIGDWMESVKLYNPKKDHCLYNGGRGLVDKEYYDEIYARKLLRLFKIGTDLEEGEEEDKEITGQVFDDVIEIARRWTKDKTLLRIGDDDPEDSVCASLLFGQDTISFGPRGTIFINSRVDKRHYRFIAFNLTKEGVEKDKALYANGWSADAEENTWVKVSNENYKLWDKNYAIGKGKYNPVFKVCPLY